MTASRSPLSKKTILGAAAIATVFAVLTVVLQPTPRTATTDFANLPNPFAVSTNSNLAGNVNRNWGVRNGFPVYEYTFVNGERSEHLAVNTIGLVRIPNDPRITQNTMENALRNYEQF